MSIGARPMRNHRSFESRCRRGRTLDVRHLGHHRVRYGRLAGMSFHITMPAPRTATRPMTIHCHDASPSEEVFARIAQVLK